MINQFQFDEYLRPIDQALSEFGYARVACRAFRTTDFEYLPAEWSNQETGLHVRLTYGLDLRDGFRSFVAELTGRRQRRLDLERALREIDPPMADLFAVGSSQVPEATYVETFASRFARSVVPACADLLSGRRWIDVPNSWDEYR